MRKISRINLSQKLGQLMKTITNKSMYFMIEMTPCADVEDEILSSFIGFSIFNCQKTVAGRFIMSYATIDKKGNHDQKNNDPGFIIGQHKPGLNLSLQFCCHYYKASE